MKSEYRRLKGPAARATAIQLLHAFVDSNDNTESRLAVRSPIALSALDSFSESERDLLIWRYVEGRTIPEIARQHSHFGPMGSIELIFKQFVRRLRDRRAFRLLEEEKEYKPLQICCPECENIRRPRAPHGGVFRCPFCDCLMRVGTAVGSGAVIGAILERARICRPRPKFDTLDYYQVLHVIPGSPWRDVDNSYHELRKKYDPVEFQRYGTAYERRALEVYLDLLNEAWTSLKALPHNSPMPAPFPGPCVEQLSGDNSRTKGD